MMEVTNDTFRLSVWKMFDTLNVYNKADLAGIRIRK